MSLFAPLSCPKPQLAFHYIILLLLLFLLSPLLPSSPSSLFFFLLFLPILFLLFLLCYCCNVYVELSPNMHTEAKVGLLVSFSIIFYVVSSEITCHFSYTAGEEAQGSAGPHNTDVKGTCTNTTVPGFVSGCWGLSWNSSGIISTSTTFEGW